MKCGWKEEAWAAYVLGLLPEKQTSLMQAHLQSCQECQGQVAGLKQASNRLQSESGPAPEFMAQRVVRAAAALEARPAFWVWRWAPLAAICLGAVALILPLRWSPSPAMTAQEVMQSYQEDMQALGYTAASEDPLGEETLDYQWLGLPQSVSQYLN